MTGERGHRHHGSRGRSTIAPYGSWRSSIDIELVVGVVAIALGEPWLDGDDVYWLEARPTEGGRRTLLRHTPRRRDPRADARPVRRSGNRVHEYGGGSYAVDRGRVVVVVDATDGRLWRLDPDGAAEPVAVTPPRAGRYADLRFDPRATACFAVRETTTPTGPDAPTSWSTSSSRSRSTGRDGAGRVLVAGPDFVAAPRPSPDGRRLAWLEWDHPDMPWDATRLRVAAVAAGRLARRGADRRRRARDLDRPARLARRRRAPLRLGRDRLVEPLRARRPRAARGRREPGADGRRARRSGVGLRPVVLRLHRRRRDPRRRPRRRARHAAPDHRAGDGPPVADRRRRSRSSRASWSRCRRRRSLIGAGPHDGAVVARLDPRPARRAGVLARSLVGADRPRAPAARRADRVPDDRRRDGARASTSRRRTTASRPRRRAAAAARPVARRPDVRRLVRAVAGPRVLHHARDRGRRRRLPGLDRLRARVPRRAQRRSGGSSTSTTASRRRGSWPTAATWTRDGWRSRAAAPAATRRSPRSPSGRGLRGRASATSGSRDLELIHLDAPQVRVALRRGPGRAVTRRPPRLPRALADPLPRPDRRARSWSCRASTTGSCRRRRPTRSWRPSHGARDPARRYLASRARATGSAAPTAIRRYARAELSFLGQVFGFTPADGIEPLDMPGPRPDWRATVGRPASRTPRRPTNGSADATAGGTLAAAVQPRSSRARLRGAMSIVDAAQYLFTSESVTEGHPDKMCDQISDAILDAIIREDPDARVACETATTTGLVLVLGEITTSTYVDFQAVVRDTVRDIGYTRADYGFDYQTCGTLVSRQGAVAGHRPGRRRGARGPRRRVGARARRRRPGDDVRLRLPRDAGADAAADRAGAPDGAPPGRGRASRASCPYLRPDGKTQVTVEYEHGVPVAVRTVVVSAQHDPDVDAERLRDDIVEAVILPTIPRELRADRPGHARQPDRPVRDRRPDGRRRA